MLSNNLFGNVAFRALCAYVPVFHVAVQIEHIDGVITDAFHQHAKALFLLALFTLLLLLLGTVAGDFGKTQQLTKLIADGVDHHMRPKRAAIFTVTPAFGFKAPGCCCGRQSALRRAVFTIVFAVEQRKILPYDFIGRVTFGALRAAIPVRHRAIGFEHVNGVIHHALYQKSVHDVRVIIHCYSPIAGLVSSKLKKILNYQADLSANTQR